MPPFAHSAAARVCLSWLWLPVRQAAREMSDSEGPPPLVDSSSDEAEGGCRRYHRDAPPSRSLQGTAVAPCLHSPDSSEPPPPPPDRSDPSPGIRREADHEHEAAEFSLSRMKQSSKLQVGSCVCSAVLVGMHSTCCSVFTPFNMPLPRVGELRNDSTSKPVVDTL